MKELWVVFWYFRWWWVIPFWLGPIHPWWRNHTAQRNTASPRSTSLCTAIVTMTTVHGRIRTSRLTGTSTTASLWAVTFTTTVWVRGTSLTVYHPVTRRKNSPLQHTVSVWTENVKIKSKLPSDNFITFWIFNYKLFIMLESLSDITCICIIMNHINL